MAETEKIEKNFIEFVYPGIIVSETSTKKCGEDDRDHPEKVKIPKSSFGFRFFKQTFSISNGETLKGEPRDYTGWFYEGAEMPASDVQKLGSEHQTLKDNMKRMSKYYRGIVWNMFGQAIPLEKKDKVIKSVPLHKTPRWKKKKE